MSMLKNRKSVLSRILLGGFILLCVSSPAHAKMVKKSAVPIIGDEASLNPGDGLAQKGDIILEQKFVATETARLQSPFTLARKKFDAKHEVTTDHVLYKVMLGDEKIAYCTFEDTFSQQPKIGKKTGTQSCFSDEDGDGKLDREFSAMKNPEMFPRLSTNLLWSDEIAFPPLEIIKSGPNSTVGVNAKIRLAKLSIRKAKFELHLQTAAGEFTSHSTQSIKFSKETSFPQEVEVFGAKLRIKSMSKDQMDYEVLSGFSVTREIALLKYMSLDDMFEVFFLDEWDF